MTTTNGIPHFSLSTSNDAFGGLSPSQLLDKIERGEEVAPVEATTNLRYEGPTREEISPLPTEGVDTESQPIDESVPLPLSDSVEEVTASPVPLYVEPPLTTQMGVEKAAEILYKCLPYPCQKATDDMLVNMKLTLTQFLLGVINRAYTSGNFASPELDPSWTTPGTSYLVSDSRCNGCGKVFTPQWRGQLYCCNACGLKVENERVAKAEERARLAKHANILAMETGAH